MNVLLTGFEPFGHFAENVSGQIALNITDIDALPSKISLETYQLPVSLDGVRTIYPDLLAKNDWDLIINLGISEASKGITLEYVALNLLDFNIPDNDGKVYSRQPISAESSNAFFTRIDIDSLKQELANQPVPCETSLSAGAYLCNYTYYLTLQHLESHRAKEGRNGAGLFVHLHPKVPVDELQDAIVSILLSLTKTS